jgi:vancomycin permeability regulator SanA
MIAFPLLQIAFFGTTDYRRASDAAVVLGARVYDNGVLSTALEDRVRTGADLYKAGLVPRLVMSGGVGANGIDEAVAMKRRAVELGVPPSVISIDSLGVDTDATVANTTAALPELGARRVLVVSQFWHLPRIKLAYRSAGWDVATVPATESDPIWPTPYLIAREIPAFWQYWARSL